MNFQIDDVMMDGLIGVGGDEITQCPSPSLMCCEGSASLQCCSGSFTMCGSSTMGGISEIHVG